MTTGRYLALVGRNQNDRERVSALGKRATQLSKLEVIAADDGFLLLADADMRVSNFGNHRGAILGTIFERDGCARSATIAGEPAIDSIVASGGRSLATHYWGGYVAILWAASDHRCDIIRDPSGFLPCYHTELQGITAIASDVRLLTTIESAEIGVDWSALHRHLYLPELRGAETCLTGVRELLRGDQLTLTSDTKQITQIWSPWTFAVPSDRIAEYRHATEALASTLRLCVSAWAHDFDHILLGMSGGLDSSIVASCLRQAGAAFTCHTISTRDPVGDERSYARSLAAALEVPLIEHWYDIAHIDITRSDGKNYPRPVSRVFAQSLGTLSMEAASEVGSDAFFSGGGGDNVFSLQRSAAPLADHYLTEGFLAARESLRNLCDLTDCSILEAIGQGGRFASKRNHAYRWNVDPSFLSRSHEHAPERNNHAWLDLPDWGLPGKARHIAMILRFQNHLEGHRHAEMAPKIAPLMSQPVIELCLRIPSWCWWRDGLDRSVARHAFADSLPADIIARRSKGSPDSFAIEIYQYFRPMIREMLNGGLLAAHQLLDLTSLNHVLDGPECVSGPHYSRILSLVDAEAWARCWYERRPSL